MSKKFFKIITIVIYVVFIFCMLSNVYAAITDNYKGDVTGVDTASITSIQDIIKAVLSVIRAVGTFIAVGILLVLACKYIIASAGDRADIKKHAISYVIGALILFGTSGVAAILKDAIDNAFSSK